MHNLIRNWTWGVAVAASRFAPVGSLYVAQCWRYGTRMELGNCHRTRWRRGTCGCCSITVALCWYHHHYSLLRHVGQHKVKYKARVHKNIHKQRTTK